MGLEVNKIYLGDALKLIPQIEDYSIDFLFCDPSYNISRKTGFSTLKGHRGTTMDFGEWDKNFDLVSWIQLIKPKLKKSANIVIFNAWENLGKIAAKIREIGYTPKRCLSYQKLNPFPANRDRLFLNSAEYALYATGEKWVFNRRQNKKFEDGIFRYPCQRKTNHTTPKPLGLALELIEILSNPGDLICDPFSGGGTFCLAAKQMNRRYLGFEINEEYWKYSQKRLEENLI